uniref:Uncharacterized protein n=1 Tax=Stomoxys calcitrans TaxID=35570 RepID=A0A1I8PNQ1_STOCA
MAPRICVTILVIAVLCAIFSPLSEGRKTVGGGGRKSGGGGHSTRRQPDTHSVTKPTYNTNSGNSHADQAKLSYPNYNSQPNRPATNGASNPSNTNSQPIGWNVNQQQSHAGPPPAYSASNVPGGAKTNMHEPPPVYQKPNYGAAPPPNYNQATGTHYGHASYPQQVPAGATYHSPNNLPPGATLYNSPSHVPGGYPMAGGYPMGGGYHAPAGGYYPANSVPAGASYFPAGGALPPGAVMYSSPPQQSSSGLGFGSGILAGAIGGAVLGHALTPTHTKVIEQAPAAGNAAGGGDRVIIINNSGQPINATDANGATIINTGGATPAPGAPAAPATSSDNPAGAMAPVAPMAPLAPMVPMAADMNATTPMPGTMPEQQQPPAPGGIICVPVRVNATDPADATKMVEVEQIACYPAPPPAAAPEAMDANNPAAPPAMPNAGSSAPLAPMQTPPEGSQQLQQSQQSTLVGDQSVKPAGSAGNQQQHEGLLGLMMCFLVSYFVAY